jgi:hypothetical protein
MAVEGPWAEHFNQKAKPKNQTYEKKHPDPRNPRGARAVLTRRIPRRHAGL